MGRGNCPKMDRAANAALVFSRNPALAPRAAVAIMIAAQSHAVATRGNRLFLFFQRIAKVYAVLNTCRWRTNEPDVNHTFFMD